MNISLKNTSIQELSNILNQARLLIDDLISRTKEQGFRLRSTEGFRSIGLFTGLSGIGYQLLRVNDPDNIPSAII